MSNTALDSLSKILSYIGAGKVFPIETTTSYDIYWKAGRINSYILEYKPYSRRFNVARSAAPLIILKTSTFLRDRHSPPLILTGKCLPEFLKKGNNSNKAVSSFMMRYACTVSESFLFPVDPASLTSSTHLTLHLP